MDGKMVQINANETPIAKPSMPLPAIYNPRRRSELPTQPQPPRPKTARAHFYRKGTSSEGTPVYSFFITRDRVERGRWRD